MRDLRFEEAFRKIAAGRRRAIKLVLIGDRAPELGRGNQPRFEPHPILVQGLGAADFRIYVERAAGHDVDLSHVDWAQLHDVLNGIPRLGQHRRDDKQQDGAGDGHARTLPARPPGIMPMTACLGHRRDVSVCLRSVGRCRGSAYCARRRATQQGDVSGIDRFLGNLVKPRV